MSGKESNNSETNILQKPNLEPIISIKEARKILGKKTFDQLSDEEIGRLISTMHFLADILLDAKFTPPNDKALKKTSKKRLKARF